MPRKLRTVKRRLDQPLSPATKYFLMAGLDVHSHVCGAADDRRWRCEVDPAMVRCTASGFIEGQWEILLHTIDVGDVWMAHRDALIAEASRFGFEPAAVQWEKGQVAFPKPIDPSVTADWRRDFLSEFGGRET
jgi:hypothetical protein